MRLLGRTALLLKLTAPWVALATLVMVAPAAHAGVERGASPQLDFTWLPGDPEIGQQVVFTVSGVPAEDIELAEWQFGGIGCDGTTSFVCTPGAQLCDLASFRYASAGEKTVMLTLTVGGTQQPTIVHTLPVQSSGACNGLPTGLEWQPTTPEIGETVVFTVTGHQGDLRTLWDFGQTGCPGYQRYQTCEPGFTDCHEVVFRFAADGVHNVAVVVSEPMTGAVLGSATAAVAVAASGSCGDGADPLYVLQTFYAPGAGGSVFRHEMELYNPNGSDAVFVAEFLPMGADNSTPAASTVVTLPGRGVHRWNNVLLDVLGLAPGELGALRLSPLPDQVRVSSIGVNFSASRTFGWVIPSARPADGLGQAEVGYVLHLSENAEHRSNIGCVNMSDATVPVTLDLYSDDGTFLEALGMTLRPFSQEQINRVLLNHAPVEGYAAITHSDPDATIVCVGMVLDTATSDPRSQPMVRAPAPGTTMYLPRAVDDDQSTTDIAILAPNGDAEARVDFLATGQDNTSYAFLTANVPDRQELRLPSIVGALTLGPDTGALRMTASSGVAAFSANESTRPSGLGMLRSAMIRRLDEQSVAHHPAAIIHLTEDNDHRTDIGVVNTTGIDIGVVVELRDASGARLGAHSLQLLPHSHLQLDGVFTAAGHPIIPGGLARIWTTTPGGAFFAYAIVTELNTQDSFEMVAMPLPADIFADGFESGDTTRWSTALP
jgi:hypothetical protein